MAQGIYQSPAFYRVTYTSHYCLTNSSMAYKVGIPCRYVAIHTEISTSFINISATHIHFIQNENIIVYLADMKTIATLYRSLLINCSTYMFHGAGISQFVTFPVLPSLQMT